MKIRPLLNEDVNQFRKLRLEALQNSPESFSSSYEEESSYPLQQFETRLRRKAGF